MQADAASGSSAFWLIYKRFMLCNKARKNLGKESTGRMSLFNSLIEIAVERPMIAGSVGAFIVGLFAAILGQPGYAVLLAFIGTGLAFAEVYFSSRG